jgi:TetR/AcrR family transcriptional repressor of bet genes
MKIPFAKIRRRELAEAAFLVMTEHGLAGTTVSRVAKRAGMSQGLVHHYFGSKADLLEAAMRQVNLRYRNLLVEAVRKVDTPREKLYAVVAVGFESKMFQQHFAQAWLSFCGEAAFNPQYARIQRILFNRMQSNIAAYLRMLLPSEQVRPAARLICMESHGLWLRCALDAKGITRDEALAQLSMLLELLLPQEQTNLPKTVAD